MPLSTVDFDQLRAITSDDPILMREVIALFLRDAPKRIERLRSALNCSDTSDCEQVAHSLVGICGTAGATSFAAVARGFERYAAARDLRRCRLALEQLAVELENVRRDVIRLL